MTTISRLWATDNGSNGNDTTLDTVTSVSVPGNSITQASSDYLEYDGYFELAATADSKRIVLSFGSVNVVDYTTTQNGGDVHISGKIIASGSGTDGISEMQIVSDGASPVIQKQSFTITWANAHTLALKMKNNTNPVSIGTQVQAYLSSVVG